MAMALTVWLIAPAPITRISQYLRSRITPAIAPATSEGFEVEATCSNEGERCTVSRLVADFTSVFICGSPLPRPDDIAGPIGRAYPPSGDPSHCGRCPPQDPQPNCPNLSPDSDRRWGGRFGAGTRSAASHVESPAG